MRSDEDKLRKCPTCGGEIGDIGMRDYSSWLFSTLPGKASASDLDCVIEHGGRFLAFEFKPNKWVPYGQKLMFNALVSSGWDLYVVVDKDFPALTVCKWNLDYLSWLPMTDEELRQVALQWWYDQGAQP